MSGKARLLQFAAAVVIALVAATLAHAQDLLIGLVSSQTSPVTAINAMGLYAGFNVYLEHINSQGGVNGRSVPKQVIQCESYNTAIRLIAKTDMVGFLARQLLCDPLLRDLREIPVAEPLPSFAVGMFTRTGTPLTQVAAAMANAVIAAARPAGPA